MDIDFGSALKAARRDRMGLTLRELARRTGLSIGYLSDLEWNRRTLPVNTVKKIAKVLGADHLIELAERARFVKITNAEYRQLTAAQKRLEIAEAALREKTTDVNWPPSDVMDLLIDATDHLLNEHDCDGPKHEEYLLALRQAKDHRSRLTALREMEGRDEAKCEAMFVQNQ